MKQIDLHRAVEKRLARFPGQSDVHRPSTDPEEVRVPNTAPRPVRQDDAKRLEPFLPKAVPEFFGCHGVFSTYPVSLPVALRPAKRLTWRAEAREGPDEVRSLSTRNGWAEADQELARGASALATRSRGW